MIERCVQWYRYSHKYRLVKTWDLTSREETFKVDAHEGIVKGLCWSKDRRLLSCASDKTIKLFDPSNTTSGSAPLATWFGNIGFTGISHHRSLNNFAASSSTISIYDLSRSSSAPLQTLNWPNSTDTITALSWNQTETSVMATCGTDRSIVLYDLRTSSPLSKLTLGLASNAICWNPMEAFNFVVASEGIPAKLTLQSLLTQADHLKDHNIYMFDMRKLKRALNVYKDHVAAVMDVDFDPTGQGLVSASYDKTIRLWDRAGGHSRDIYHTKRMQRVFSCKFTPDAKYVLSGSDDGNIRIWRANASERAGVKSARQRQKLEYDDALRERYAHMPEIRRIKRHRHVPKAVKKAGEIKGEELAAIKRRRENERKHSKKGSVPRRSEREKMVLATEQ